MHLLPNKSIFQIQNFFYQSKVEGHEGNDQVSYIAILIFIWNLLMYYDKFLEQSLD